MDDCERGGGTGIRTLGGFEHRLLPCVSELCFGHSDGARRSGHLDARRFGRLGRAVGALPMLLVEDVEGRADEVELVQTRAAQHVLGELVRPVSLREDDTCECSGIHRAVAQQKGDRCECSGELSGQFPSER